MSVIINHGLDNTVTTNDVETVNDILTSSRLKAYLGFSDNVEAVLNGCVVSKDYVLTHGDTVTLRAKAGAKGGTPVTVAFGLDNEVTNAEHETAGGILRDSRLKAYLGYSDNVEAVIDGVVVGSDYVLDDEDRVVLRVKAGQKGC